MKNNYSNYLKIIFLILKIDNHINEYQNYKSNSIISHNQFRLYSKTIKYN